jgi:hypothetical protein
MADNRNIIIGLLVIVAIFLAFLAMRPMMYSPAYSPGDYQSSRMGPGMMYGPGYNYSFGPGMMGNMMGGMRALYHSNARPITQDEALRNMKSLALQYGSNVEIEDFMAFSSSYYAILKDVASGQNVAEVLVDRYSGSAYPEPGPNMMWNTRYNAGRSQAGVVVYDIDGAKKLADDFLADYLPGAQILEANEMPGYYTFDFGRKEIEGMLSVNPYSGQVWVHTWHGFYLGGMNATS